MIQKIKTALLIIVTGLMTMGTPAIALPGVALADNCADAQHNLNNGVNSAVGNGGNCELSGSTPTNSLASISKTAVNVLSLVVGILAVIMIIYGGLRYVTSGGSSEGVGSAKNIIIYAIIGLIIVALAQLIVHFVLNAAITTNVNSTS